KRRVTMALVCQSSDGSGPSFDSGGLSFQYRHARSIAQIEVPILEVRAPSPRSGPPYTVSLGLAGLVAITVQIPFETATCCSPLGGGKDFALLFPLGNSLKPIDVLPFTDQVHILTSCDTFMTNQFEFQAPENPNGAALRLDSCAYRRDPCVGEESREGGRGCRIRSGYGTNEPSAGDGKAGDRARVHGNHFWS